jgi:tRNA modification GTPase
MHYHLADTIVAVASPAGGAARGIIRLSGPRVVDVVAAVFRPDGELRFDLKHARTYAGQVRLNPLDRELPATLYLWPGSSSYTREPAAELHTLGSPPLLAAIVRQLAGHGARPAEPGEFTLRAFLAGRIDLTQAEAVLGIIDARGRRDLDVALEQMAGGLAQPITGLRESLLDLLARLEAGLDFVEDDIEFITAAEIEAELDQAGSRITALSKQLGARGRLDETVRAVLVGPPNVGKSSLFNALTRSGALVSNEPGTTRDYLVARIDQPGSRCELIDTAGVEMGAMADGVGRQAQDQTNSQVERAQITLLCFEFAQPLTPWQQARLAVFDPSSEIAVLTKADQSPGLQVTDGLRAVGAIVTSARSGVGIEKIGERLHELVCRFEQPELAAVGATAARVAESLRAAAAALERAQLINRQRAREELVAAEVRMALDELGKVSGAVATDDVLERIFSRFCIGK